MLRIFLLLAAYQFKHFLADFPLQGKYMLGKFKPGLDFLGPLTAHCAVHAGLTFGIVWVCRPKLAVQLAITDFVIHFVMDRIKASPNMLGRFKNFSGNEYCFIAAGYQPPSMFYANVDDQGGGIVPLTTLTPEKKLKTFIDNKLFWWALGLDQMVHHFTHYYIIYRIMS